jgi:hypothetical protein
LTNTAWTDKIATRRKISRKFCSESLCLLRTSQNLKGSTSLLNKLNIYIKSKKIGGTAVVALCMQEKTVVFFYLKV